MIEGTYALRVTWRSDKRRRLRRHQRPYTEPLAGRTHHAADL